MKILDMDYNSQRTYVRAYTGVQLDIIKTMRKVDVDEIINYVRASDIMCQAGFSDEKIREQFEQAAIDGYVAFEIIREDQKIIDLMELDPATLVPRYLDGKFRWVQNINTEDEIELGEDDILYIQMRNTFDKIINLIDK